jgi:hypothetical protein
MSAPSDVKQRRPLIWWGSGLMVVALAVGLLSVVLIAMRIGGGLIDAFSADVHATPAQLTMHLDAGTYCIYERSGSQQDLPFDVAAGHAITVSLNDVTVTSDSGSNVPIEATGFDETLTRDSTKFTAAAQFDIDSSGVYTVAVATPHTEVVVAPSIVWIFKSSLTRLALAALSGMTFAVGLVLLIVGFIKSQRAKAPRPLSTAPAGWYSDPTQQSGWRWWDGRSWSDRTG